LLLDKASLADKASPDQLANLASGQLTVVESGVTRSGDALAGSVHALKRLVTDRVQAKPKT
jgi:hypothetical protein